MNNGQIHITCRVDRQRGTQVLTLTVLIEWHRMRVPGPIRAVFDRFPLATLPEHASQNVTETEPILAVYGLDNEGLPLDPKCLIMAALLRKKNIKVRTTSPYISSLETLPVLINDAERSVHSTLDYILSQYFPEEAQDPTLTVYRSLVETWLDDAWHECIMDPAHAATKEHIYADKDTNSQFPWPFSALQRAQLNAQLEERFVKGRAAVDDDYMVSQGNLLRAGLTVNALDEIIDPAVKEPTILDILVFAYTWPITQLLPDSALAALITPKLREHSQSVRHYLTS